MKFLLAAAGLSLLLMSAHQSTAPPPQPAFQTMMVPNTQVAVGVVTSPVVGLEFDISAYVDSEIVAYCDASEELVRVRLDADRASQLTLSYVDYSDTEVLTDLARSARQPFFVVD